MFSIDKQDKSEIKNVNPIGWNVINEYDFKKKVKLVFDMVADSLSKSIGPFGQNTIIEQMGDYHITKDGWTILKSIRFDNDNVANTIMRLLLNISAIVS